MFGTFAYRFAGPGDPDSADNWGPGWTPPWFEGGWRHIPPHVRLRLMHMRRAGGPFWGGGRGPGSDPRGPFGGGPFGRGERFFGRGDVKFALLDLLRERPMYGYEMIKALEEKSGGFYTPSPGSIYPTLQMLEERGFVTSEEVESKKVYSITEAGRALLEEHQKQEQFNVPPWERLRHGYEGFRRGPHVEMQALRREAMEVARLFALAGRSAFNDPQRVPALRGIIERTRKELNDLIYGESGSSTQTSTPPPPDGE